MNFVPVWDKVIVYGVTCAMISNGLLYLANRVAEHSRHIYDLYRLSSVVEINDDLKLLAKSVAEDRKPHKACLSVQDDADMHQLLQEIIDNDAYKGDCDSITASLREG